MQGETLKLRQVSTGMRLFQKYNYLDRATLDIDS